MELSSSTIALLTITSFIIWGALYGILRKSQPHWSHEWNCRVIMVVHAITIMMMSTLGRMHDPTTWPITHLGNPSNIYGIITMSVCLGYFIFDFCWCIWLWSDDVRNVMTVHHIVSILGLAAALLTGLSGTEIGLCIILLEASNPMLQFRWFLRSSGIKDGFVYELNEVMFIATFGVCRLGIFPLLLYQIIMHPLPLLVFKICGVLLQLVSIVMFVKILKVWLRKCLKGAPK